jgi:hypothetical protein
MRMIGPVGSYRELGVQDHLCWVHGDPRDYRPRLSDFFRDGLERGLRVAYLGSEDAGELRELLGRVADTGTPLVSGEAVRVISFEEFYGAAEPVDPAAVIKRYDAATQEALADGYRGLRVSADVTDLVVRLSGGTPSPAARSCWSVTRRGIRCRRCAGTAANSAMQ